MRICCACVFVPVALALALNSAATGGDKKEVEKKTTEVKKGEGPGRTKGAKTPVNPPVLLTAPGAPGQVEVRFSNGSVVMMNLLQDRIEVVTDYGKLLVPAADIRAIDFGVHASPTEKRKLDEAIERLGSASHAERETAQQELVAMGPLAYLKVLAAGKSKDLEVARRAEAAVKAIREKYPARLLRTREDDVVRTHKFNIVGRISTPTFKAKADDFGELDLRPSRMLAIRWLAGDTKRLVTVDASQYGLPNNQKWMATGIRLDPHVGVRITATGQVNLLQNGGGQGMCGPDGLGGMAMGRGRMFGNGQTGGELMGRIGDSGQMFYIGARHTMTPKTAGQLFLLIQPSPWGQIPTGEYRVTVATGPLMDDAEGDN